MEKNPTGRIRKLIIGEDPKNGFSFEVDYTYNTPGGKLKVVEIMEDQNNYYFFGVIRFIVYVEKEDKSIVVWKYFDNMAIMAECFI